MLIPVEAVHRQRLWIFSVAAVLVCLSIVLSVRFGAVPLNWGDVFGYLINNESSQAAAIIETLRLPRALLAAAIGGLMATSGAVSQGLFRNPLADPSLIGVSAGAAAGASLVIVFAAQTSWTWFGLSFISLGAFVGALVAVAFVYRLATGAMGTSVATMLLAGIAISFMAGALTNVLEYVADNEMLRRMSLWRMGGLETASYSRVVMASCVMAVFIVVLPRFSDALNALLLGESEARHLGINVERIKIYCICIIALGVAVSVALAGTIAFIGLVIPHMVRIVIGPDHRFLVPLSAAAGAILLVIADVFARVLIAPSELPVGILTALIGAPVFISLLRRRHRYGI